MKYNETIPFDLTLLAGLTTEGIITEANNYQSMRVDEQFVTVAFSSIRVTPIVKPDYAAHISIVYPEEVRGKNLVTNTPPVHAVGFTVEGLAKISIKPNTYIALVVRSEFLENYRKTMGLNPYPIFRDVEVPFHITVAKRVL